ncbi:transcriptional regulator [Clostridia bacterium]|nr:transcriptional regulator [Clostridia bacterium]
MPIDFKKTEKELYQPKGIAILTVPNMKFITINGRGNPNGEEFQTATEILYALSYSIKMNNKEKLEYVVPPLEGLWWSGVLDFVDKEEFIWTIMIRQPDFVDDNIFHNACEMVTKKKKLEVAMANFSEWSEGKCVQTIHIGSYDTERETIDSMVQFAKGQGYEIEPFGEQHMLKRTHHEIYLSDPRKTTQEKLKTIIRYPIRG